MTVLIVEDDDVYRKRLAKALERRGYTVLSAASVSACAECLQGESSISHAIIDLRIGEGSGIDVLKLLLGHSPNCRAVVLTGYGTITTSVTAMKLGAVDYLTKPTDPDTILEVLKGERASQVKDEPVPTPSLEQNEWEHIQRVLTDTGGNITLAAKRLGMHRRSLQRKLAKQPSALR